MIKRCLVLAACWSATLVHAQTVYLNANVWTAHPARSRAEAFVVQDGRFVAVGSNVEALRAFTLAPRTSRFGPGSPARSPPARRRTSSSSIATR